MKELYYELTDNGYHIYDKNDPLFHIHQYEPYIPNPSNSYEENAKAHIEALSDELEIEEPNNPYGIPNNEYTALVENIQQQTIDEIVKGVSADDESGTN